jgi:hypothetical protein
MFAAGVLKTGCEKTSLDFVFKNPQKNAIIIP